MSHFTVTVRLTAARLARHATQLTLGAFSPEVITSALDEILEPFDENVEKGSPYAEFRDVTEEYRKQYDESAEHKAEYATFEDFMRKYGGYKQHTDGRWGYWRNPNAKWDWYVVGGRWRGFFPVKAGTNAIVGKPGAFENDAKAGGADIVRKYQLDFDQVLAQQEEAFATFKDEYRRYLAGEKFDSWDGPRDRLLRLGVVRVEQDPHAVLAANEVQVGNAWGEDHPHIRGTERDHWRDIALVLSDDELAKFRCDQNPLVPYAAVDDDGWHAAGEMGWWGMSSDTPDAKLAFAAAYVEKFIKTLGDDDVLVNVDCHI